jgi:uncharacterized protein YecE (DUF72 family)
MGPGFGLTGTAGKDMLSFYASQFNTIELNYTWYQMPKAEAMERMLLRVPPDFVLTAKLTRTMTHEIYPKNWRTQVGVTPSCKALITRKTSVFLTGVSEINDNEGRKPATIAALSVALL